VFTGVEWDNDTVSNFFLVMFSILTDVAPGHVACFLWVNSLTSRVPFASVTGATCFLTIDADSHCMTTVPRVQSYYDRPGFGAPDGSWEDLAELITNFADFLEIVTRVMHGLLAYDGDVYLSIKALDPFACLESSSVICELFYHVSAASVSKNWSLFNSFEYTPGSDMRDFTRRLLELKNKLDADGRCLDRQRPGPLAIDTLQIAIDAIRATGTLVRATSTSLFLKGKRYWTDLLGIHGAAREVLQCSPPCLRRQVSHHLLSIRCGISC
jgi:hypothetical protein